MATNNPNMKNKYIIITAILSLGVMSCGGSNEVEATESHDTHTEIVKETTEEEVVTTVYVAGEEIYGKTCKACHQANGEGIASVFPPLANSDYLLEDKLRAIKQIIEGSSEEMVVNGETYNGTMTPQNLEDQEIIDVMNYVLNSWGNAGGEVTLEDVQSQKDGE